MQHIFIVGSKGIPGAYGGYETFVDKLTEYHENKKALFYHVACKAKENSEFSYNGARCFKVNVPNIGPAQAIYYDVAALKACCSYIREHDIQNPIVYILACRIGPFMKHFCRKIHKLGGKVYINPDGHEWMRAKWSAPVRKYWKISEQMMVKDADLIICDSKNIEKYIQNTYRKYNPNTTFIAYGAEVTENLARAEQSDKLTTWFKEQGLKAKEYYLVVGRFVPENNYETMIREFMKSDTTKDFALITKVTPKFLNDLKSKTGFDKDSRIKFVGTVYDQELLSMIRKDAYGYFHGHEVGGTNPSLLEALGATELNLLLDVGFNREVAEDAAIYWTKEEGSLAAMIHEADALDSGVIQEYGRKAKERISDAYSWQFIADQYEKVFSGEKQND